jgi:catechol 2,3-dioxygenase-like lactoylglutathione lyase family enzyme
MRPQPLIAVTDVEASSRWYQHLLGCRSNRGGRAYEQLVSNGKLILQLHSFDVEHHHGRIGDPLDKPFGNGVLLWFEVDDFDAVMRRSAEMGVEIVLPGIEIHPMVRAVRIIGSAGCGIRKTLHIIGREDL